jgi:hypothetical protein
MDKGKLRKTTGKKCPNCGRPIQIREIKGRLLKVCYFCDYSEALQGRVRSREKEEDME